MFGLFELCERAKARNINIMEPKFGWKKPVPFGEIFDIEYFNDNMSEVKMIPRNKAKNYNVEYIEGNWGAAAGRWSKQRSSSSIPQNAMHFQVLKALRLNKTNESKAQSIVDIDKLDGIHLRIEGDWERYLKGGPPQLKGEKAENNFLINVDTFVKMYKKFTDHKNILLSTGENHQSISKTFAKHNIKTVFYFDPSVEYEISAAINFFLCTKCQNFIGISRSTFSNLVATSRYITGINNSYIYNYENKIHERIDLGLQLDPKLAVTKKTEVLDA